MIEEKVYDEISPLIKERCGLPYHWYQLNIDQKDFVFALLEAQKNIRVEKMKHLLLERIRYKIEEYREEREHFASVAEAQESFDNLLDELEILVDEWFEDDNKKRQ